MGDLVAVVLLIGMNDPHGLAHQGATVFFYVDGDSLCLSFRILGPIPRNLDTEQEMIGLGALVAQWADFLGPVDLIGMAGGWQPSVQKFYDELLGDPWCLPGELDT